MMSSERSKRPSYVGGMGGTVQVMGVQGEKEYLLNATYSPGGPESNIWSSSDKLRNSKWENYEKYYWNLLANSSQDRWWLWKYEVLMSHDQKTFLRIFSYQKQLQCINKASIVWYYQRRNMEGQFSFGNTFVLLSILILFFVELHNFCSLTIGVNIMCQYDAKQ